MYTIQEACLEALYCSPASVVVSAPTGAGKTVHDYYHHLVLLYVFVLLLLLVVVVEVVVVVLLLLLLLVVVVVVVVVVVDTLLMFLLLVVVLVVLLGPLRAGHPEAAGRSGLRAARQGPLPCPAEGPLGEPLL